MCYVDIRDAFGSINDKFMIDELKRAGYPSLFINITADVYNNSTFQVKTACGLTQPIKRQRGVIQGCPWSIIIFEQGIDQWLRYVESDYPRGHPSPIRGYVDDVLMIADSIEEMKTMTDKTTEFLNYTGMEAKPSKCAVTSAQRTGNNYKPSPSASISIQEKTIPYLNKEDSYKYLGYDINLTNTSNDNQCDKLVNDFKSNMSKIHLAPLSISIKCKLIQTLCISPLMFFFQNIFFTEIHIDSLENCIVFYIREWFKLNKSSSRHFIFSPRSCGGLGIPNPRILYYAKHLAFYLSVLNSNDTLVKMAASDSLRLHMTKRKVEFNPLNDQNFCGYSTDNKGNFCKNSKVNWPKSQWQLLSYLCSRCNINLYLSNNEFVFIHNVDDEVSFRFNCHYKFYNHFKKFQLNEVAASFKILSSQGRIVRENESINYKLSFAFLDNLNLKDDIKTFAIKGRLQLLECDSILHTWYPLSYQKHCKLCANPSDTVSHILNGCMPLKSYYIERHNRIVKLICAKINSHVISDNVAILTDKFLKPSTFDNKINNDCTFTTSCNRPDITVIDHSSKSVKIIEISTPFDAHIDKCFASKFLKYSPLASEIENLGFATDVIVLILGSLGSVHNRFVSGLLMCALPRQDALFLTRYLSISSIIGSFRIWKKRCQLHFRYE